MRRGRSKKKRSAAEADGDDEAKFYGNFKTWKRDQAEIDESRKRVYRFLRLYVLAGKRRRIKEWVERIFTQWKHYRRESHRQKWIKSIWKALRQAKEEAVAYGPAYAKYIATNISLIAAAFVARVLDTPGWAIHANLNLHPMVFLEILLLLKNIPGFGVGGGRDCSIYAVFSEFGAASVREAHDVFCRHSYSNCCGGACIDESTSYCNVGSTCQDSLQARYSLGALFFKLKGFWSKDCSLGFMYLLECFQLALLHWILGGVDGCGFSLPERLELTTTECQTLPLVSFPVDLVRACTTVEQVGAGTIVPFAGHTEMTRYSAGTRGVAAYETAIESFLPLMARICAHFGFVSGLNDGERAMHERSAERPLLLCRLVKKTAYYNSPEWELEHALYVEECRLKRLKARKEKAEEDRILAAEILVKSDKFRLTAAKKAAADNDAEMAALGYGFM
mmetsp:Transcript_30198/g.61526  ORF Transcript_30198/g.61526 Transcript_30198/m.61526 type:complete len:449 (-) Transcript_30198:60-1406(-)|eukprot:CAMPEP_0171699542 /NCGR_PEP_ID=MMETSP0991-20121206/10036_1 /TAXON_ID=483369 /ORGANISM="non described non described, Strain CCMP2098" /LENGTH=448 /DNA_ID=CAMNT_0012288661 /DNA_START=117 /DNA_END=1463 /DNA_ORIENTATION=+